MGLKLDGLWVVGAAAFGVALLAACTARPLAGGSGGSGGSASPGGLAVGCATAAATVVASDPLGGTSLRILQAEDQAATDKASASCLVEGAMNERISAVDGRPYAIKFRLRLPEPVRWNGKFYMEGGGGANGILTEAVGIAPGTRTNAFERGYARRTGPRHAAALPQQSVCKET